MSSSHPKSSRTAIVIPIAHALLMSALVLLFTWPALTLDPHGVPIGIVGPAPIADTVATQIEAKRAGVFDITVYESASDAKTAINEKEIYGAIEIGAPIRVLIATAANPAVSQLLSELGSAVNEATLLSQGISVPTVEKVDLAPLPENDQRGQVIGSAALPLVIAGISLGALVSLRVQGRWSQIGVVVASSLLTGTTLTLLLNTVFSVLPGNIALTALAMSAIIGAISLTLVGAHRLAGIAGFGILAATFFLVGNPLSGISIPAEFYLDGWGAVGQALPLGAGFELIKRINFFELADVTSQWWTLGAWIGVGLAMWGLSFAIQHNRAEKTAAQ